MQRFRPILNEAGISEQQWRVLRTLNDEPDIDAATLAGRAQILAPSLTRMLRVLEGSALIERHPAPDDLRRQMIRLSTKGRKTVARLSPRIEAVYQDLETLIGPKLLTSIYANVGSMIEKIRLPEA